MKLLIRKRFKNRPFATEENVFVLLFSLKFDSSHIIIFFEIFYLMIVISLAFEIVVIII